MRVRPAVEFAIRGMLVLAERHGQGPVALDAICAHRDLPKQYLTKIFNSLTRSGLILPVRGKGGGFLLARPPAATSLLEVIEAIQGPVAFSLCPPMPDRCPDDCRMRGLWDGLQGYIRDKLSATSLADCVKAAPDVVGNL